jgi:hypothetical protein
MGFSAEFHRFELAGLTVGGIRRKGGRREPPLEDEDRSQIAAMVVAIAYDIFRRRLLHSLMGLIRREQDCLAP